MEWSLSIDNIFVFILIFDAFKVKEMHLSRVLLIGILVSIVFLIVLRSSSGFVWGLLGLIIFSLTLILAIKIYKKSRDKNDNTLEEKNEEEKG